MRKPALLPPQLRGESFTVAEAHLLGVNDGRLRRSDLTRPFHGVRSTAAAAPVGTPGIATTDAERRAQRLSAARERARQ